ncbi:unnamed protein product [Sphagnum troendelagicum]|uniref:H15 domain-containing protein n=1 Tax=Sphagnum troendelagicum TaxID=128251 RepID=A0ABP0U4V3_9BRYO
MGSSKGSQLSGKPRAGIKALVLQRPQYSQMVSSALTDLKQNKGSKVSTIIKKVHSTWGEQLPSDYKKSVGKVINRLVKLGKLEKDDNDRYALTATRKGHHRSQRWCRTHAKRHRHKLKKPCRHQRKKRRTRHRHRHHRRRHHGHRRHHRRRRHAHHAHHRRHH